MKGIPAMSHNELERQEVISEMEKNLLTDTEGSGKRGISKRQM